MKNYRQDGRGLYATSPDQIKDYVLTFFAKDAINLGNVNNTNDLDKPISNATQQALNNKVSKNDPYVVSINNLTGNVTLTSATLGLGNVNNTSDLNKPISNATKAALDDKVDNNTFVSFRTSTLQSLSNKVDLTEKGVASGLATLDNQGVLTTSQIPTIPKSKVPTALTADRFSTPVEIVLLNDVQGNAVIDGGSSTLNLSVSLKESGVIPGTYGSLNNIPRVTVNNKGIVTNIEYVEMPPASTTQSGIISLNDTIGSTSNTQAATIRTVTETYRLADETNKSSVKTSLLGLPNGVATLDDTGKLKPEQLPLAGTIAADRLANARTISMTGDGSWQVSFNGSGNVSGLLTLSTVLNTPGTFGSATHTPVAVVDARGRITKIENKLITPTFANIGSKPTTVAGYGITDAYNKTQTDEIISQLIKSATPPGLISYYAARNAPDGWLVCDGRAVSRVTYSELFKVIGTLYGPGDGSTTFNLPQAGGEFIRGWSGNRDVDTGRVFGSYQEGDIQSHTHLVKEGSIHPNRAGNNEYLASGDDFTQVHNYLSTTTATGGKETRPRNIALLTIIKY